MGLRDTIQRWKAKRETEKQEMQKALGPVYVKPTEVSQTTAQNVVVPTSLPTPQPGGIDKAIKKEKKLTLSRGGSSGGGGVYIPPTDQFGRSEAWYDEQNANRELRTNARRTAEALQNQVNTGMLSAKRANDLLDLEIDRRVNMINQKLQNKYQVEPEWRLQVNGSRRAPPRTNKGKVKATIKETSPTKLFVKQTAKTAPVEKKGGKLTFSPTKAKKIALDVGLIVAGEVVGAGILLIRGARVASVTAIGASKNVQGVRVTRLKFKNLAKIKKTIGEAYIFTVGKGKKSFSVTLGNVKRGKKVQQLFGVEGSAGISKKVIKRELQSFIAKDGTINTIQVIKRLKGIQGAKSGSLGFLATGTTKRGVLFPSGKLKEVVNINLNSFVSVARSFTKKDISLILGKTITNEKKTAQFLAVIKNLDKTSKTGGVKLSGGELQQYQAAVKKTVGVVSAALARSKIVAGTKSGSIPVATKIIKDSIKKAKTSTQVKTEIKKFKTTSVPRINPTQITRIKSITRTIPTAKAVAIVKTPKSKLKDKQKTITKQIIREQTKLKKIQAIKPVQKSKTRQAQAIKNVITQLKQELRLVRALSVLPPISTFPPKLFIAPFKFKTKRRPTKPTPTIKGYNVYVKSRGKFKKMNTLPLSKTDAQDRGAYIVDNSTAATYKLVPLTKVKKLGKITAKEKGARKKIKQREYKYKKKRKISTPRRYIEKKGKPRINTRGEKKGLSAAKVYKTVKKKPIKRKPVKKKVVKRKR
jgi:hypothetical protein